MHGASHDLVDLCVCFQHGLLKRGLNARYRGFPRSGRLVGWAGLGEAPFWVGGEPRPPMIWRGGEVKWDDQLRIVE